MRPCALEVFDDDFIRAGDLGFPHAVDTVGDLRSFEEEREGGGIEQELGGGVGTGGLPCDAEVGAGVPSLAEELAAAAGIAGPIAGGEKQGGGINGERDLVSCVQFGQR